MPQWARTFSQMSKESLRTRHHPTTSKTLRVCTSELKIGVQEEHFQYVINGRCNSIHVMRFV